MKRKKGLCLLLSVLMVCMLMPMTALAAGTSADVGTKDEFLAALKDPSITTINITANIDLTEKIPAGQGVLLDLSGRTIDLGGNTIKANNFALIYEGSNFTIKNGTFDGNGGSYALFIGDSPTDNVVIQDVTAIGGINVYNSTNVVLRNVDVTGTNYYAVWCDEGGQVQIESGTFQTNGVAVLGLAEGPVDSSMAVEGGDFHTNGKPLVLDDGKDREPPVISGGTFDCSAKEYVAEGLEYERNSSGVYTYHETLADAMKDADADTVISAVDNPATGDTAFEATLDYSDGSGTVIRLAGDADGNITLPAIGGRSGYVFLGWDNGDGHTIAAGQPYQLTENITFTGTWKELTKVKTQAKAATCMEDGNIEYWYCPELQMYFKNEALTQPVDLADTIIKAAGHHGETRPQNEKAATCTEEGYTGDQVCVLCNEVVEQGAVIPKLAHSYRDGKCAVCGAADPGVKPVGPTTDVPQTGDMGNLVLWGALLLIAGAGIAAAVIFNSRKSRRHAK